MTLRSHWYVGPALAALMAAGLTSGAQAQVARVGMLTCEVSGSMGNVVMSSKQLNCLFSPSDGAPQEQYVGTIDRYGLDVGVTGPGRLAWGVFAPATAPGPGALQGTYSGPTGGATVGVGATGNYLLSNSGAFNLQALSISGQTGLNLTAGVAQMTLQYVPPPMPRMHRHHRWHHRRYR